MHKLGILGLGYVGLPLAVEFAKSFEVIGYDKSELRIDQLNQYIDKTLEVDTETLEKSNIHFTTDSDFLSDCDVYIVTVPTPITQSKQPDLSPLISASKQVGKYLNKGDIVIYESTVYPGCTEEVCVPLLEQESGLKFNEDFFCGYSPERINPGDKQKTVVDIVKVTSGSNEVVATKIDDLYKKIIRAGTFKASSIKVAEAAKVIENTQRDINIAFVNELSMIFNRLDIDTLEVLEAAGTKWNFLPFKPGLVGGHCIGVDPYYLTHKAESLGYHPEIILAGRRINDNMGSYVASQVVKSLIKKGKSVASSKILVLGVTFKENCPDIRNSKVFDVIQELEEFGCNIDVYDPWVDDTELLKFYQVKNQQGSVLSRLADYDGIIFCVAHKQFKELNLNDMNLNNSVVYDLKGMFPSTISDGRL